MKIIDRCDMMVRLVLMKIKGVIVGFGILFMTGMPLSAHEQIYPDSAVVVALTPNWAATGEMSGNRISVRDSKDYIHAVYDMYRVMHDSAEIYYTFSTDNGLTWSKPENISKTGSLASYEPCLAVDSMDYLHCIWKQFQYDSTGLIMDLYYSQRDSTGWSQPINISKHYEFSGDDFYSSMVVDSKDHVHVVWDHQGSAGNWDIFYTCYNGTTWTDPYQVSNTSYDDAFPALSVDHNDVLHVVWRQRTIGGPIFYRYKDSLGWSTPEIATSIGGQSVASTMVADSKTRLHLVFNNSVTGFLDLYYTCRDTSGWTPPENLTQSNIGSGHPSLAIDSLDHLYLVWSENQEILYRTYDGSSWSNIQNLSQDPVYSQCPKLGNPISSQGVDLIWVSNDYPGPYDLLYLKLTLVGVEEDKPGLLKSFDIRALPNPFTDKVTIEYHFAETADVRCKILDVSGRVIEQFEQKLRSSDHYRLTWHADNQPAGVYFLLFDIGGKTQSLRLVKIK